MQFWRDPCHVLVSRADCYKAHNQLLHCRLRSTEHHGVSSSAFKMNLNKVRPTSLMIWITFPTANGIHL